MFRNIYNFFDKFEDKIRISLSRFPIVYTLIGGISVVLFWRGVWHTADILQGKGGILGFLFYEPINMIIVVIILLASGLFVSYFIGDTILISGLKQQKKITEKTEKELKEEEGRLDQIMDSIKEIKEDVNEIKEEVKNNNISDK